MEAKEILLTALNEAKQVGVISSLDVDNLLTKLTSEAKKAGIKQGREELWEEQIKFLQSMSEKSQHLDMEEK